MPVLSTNRGYIDEERVRTILIRLLEAPGNIVKSIWEYYNDMAADEDNTRGSDWWELADTILVFDGLFAAFLSAFLVFTIPQLQPNSTDIAMDVLIHISQQLSNSTTPAYSPAEFTVSPRIAAVNILFFLSLALVLIDAFLAMLVKSWIQEFNRGWRNEPGAKFRAYERERRLKSLERWKLAELIALLSILIQTSLLLFCIGLIVLIFPIHLISAIVSLVALVAGLTFYWFTISVCIFDDYAPFSSPLSRGLRMLIDTLPSTLSSLTTRVEKQDARARSRYQIDPQTCVNILDRLVTTTAEDIENVYVFQELLDQPRNDTTLWPSNKKWNELFRTTLQLLGDPSTFSHSTARTITRSLLFCFDNTPADRQLSESLINLFDRRYSHQFGRERRLETLFAPYLHYYCKIDTSNAVKVCKIIAYLEPSDAADLELLWMVKTFHNNLLWKSYWPNRDLLSIFAAVLTYVSCCTGPRRRSQVELTVAIIYAVHTIQSEIGKGGTCTITRPPHLPGTRSAFESICFHHVDTLGLWSDDCVEHTSALLQPNVHMPQFDASDVCRFQLALIAALYVDSTQQQTSEVAAAFSDLIKLPKIPEITISTWGWADAYDQAKLAGYWYTALFQEPMHQEPSENSPVREIGDIIVQTIGHCSELTLSALHLLDFSVKYLRCRSSSLLNLLTLDMDGDLHFKCADTDGPVAHGPFNPWILLHLDTLFSPGFLLHQIDLEHLVWNDTHEQVHIAMARLALHDSLQGEEGKEMNPPRLDPELLDLFLKSKDDVVYTGALKCCLTLAIQPCSAGVIQSAETFMIGTIEHLISSLCGTPWHESSRSWQFLTEHLTPKWASLPLSWRCDFVLAFMSLKVRTPAHGELPAYQWFANSLRDEEQTNEPFLPFLETMLSLIISSVTGDQLNSIDTWLAQLPAYLENQDAHVKLDNMLATRRL